jgi:hypothetical protein
MTETASTPSVLFICVKNGGKSQMAAEHDNGTLRMAGEQISGGGAHGGGFGAATVERVGGEPPTLRFIVRAEPPSGERQQLGFEVRGNDFDVDAAEADTNMKRRARCSVTCSISRSAALVRLHSEGTGTHERYPITLRDHEDLNLMGHLNVTGQCLPRR